MRKKRAQINPLKGLGWTMVEAAVLHGQVETVRQFLDLEPKLVQFKGVAGAPLLQLAIMRMVSSVKIDDRRATISLLLERGADVAARNKQSDLEDTPTTQQLNKRITQHNYKHNKHNKDTNVKE